MNLKKPHIFCLVKPQFFLLVRWKVLKKNVMWHTRSPEPVGHTKTRGSASLTSWSQIFSVKFHTLTGGICPNISVKCQLLIHYLRGWIRHTRKFCYTCEFWYNNINNNYHTFHSQERTLRRDNSYWQSPWPQATGFEVSLRHPRAAWVGHSQGRHNTYYVPALPNENYPTD